MGGAPVYVEADGIFVGKADFAERHQVRQHSDLSPSGKVGHPQIGGLLRGSFGYLVTGYM